MLDVAERNWSNHEGVHHPNIETTDKGHGHWADVHVRSQSHRSDVSTL